MIRRAAGWYLFVTQVLPRVELVHGDLLRIVQTLNDAGLEVWTGQPPTGGYNLSGWRQHFADEATRLAIARTRFSVALVSSFGECINWLDQYLEAVPRVRSAMDTVLAQYPDPRTLSAAVSGVHRQSLASAIQVELE